MKAWGLPQYLSAICALHHMPVVAAAPDNVDLHLVRLTSALSTLSEPLFAFRAMNEILQSADALKMDAFAIRSINTELKQALIRSEALPKGGTGKILKRELRERFWEGKEKRVQG